MRKKLIFILLILFGVVILFFIKNAYKNTKMGNNISKSDYIDILNISSYEATVEIEVHSNKNINKYIMKQQYSKPNIFKQEIIEPSNIKGITITYDGTNTILENNALNLRNLYENFRGDTSNLSLTRFIEEYKEGTGSRKEETENETIMRTEITKNKNKYQTYQNLYISKSTNLPTKMEIQDVNKNTTVYILYNEISINK